MRWSFHQMNIAEFAAFEQSQGQRIIKTNTLYWVRVRPFFYRPLLPYQKYAPDAVRAPAVAWLGACQYGVASSEQANSCLNLLIFDSPQTYSIKDLDRHERREIRRASEVFNVLPILDADEFKQKAHPVYTSFYDRTGYQYKTERRDLGGFSKWADVVYASGKAMVLGAYRADGRLGAVGIWHLVEDTLVYSTFFCDSDSLKQHVTGLMLHAMREAVVEFPAVKQIFVGMHKFGGRSSVDGFYLTRGCTVVRQPARVVLNPLAKSFLAICLPKQYEKLLGQLERDLELGSPGQEQADLRSAAPSASRAASLSEHLFVL